MKQLTSDQQAQRNTIVNELLVRSAEIESAMMEINRIVAERLNVAIANYNLALEEARGFRSTVVSSMLETEKAGGMTPGETSAYADWRGEWEEVDLDGLEAVLGFEGPDHTHAEELGSLATEPELPF